MAVPGRSLPSVTCYGHCTDYSTIYDRFFDAYIVIRCLYLFIVKIIAVGILGF